MSFAATITFSSMGIALTEHDGTICNNRIITSYNNVLYTIIIYLNVVNLISITHIQTHTHTHSHGQQPNKSIQNQTNQPTNRQKKVL